MANIVRWEPLRDMISLREAMDRLFEESFVSPRSARSPFWGDEGKLALDVDVYETEDAIKVEASVPGVKPEDIDITITGDVLTIRGETRDERQVEKSNCLRQERRYGSFHRSLTLPVQVQTDKTEAVFENGVLSLILPKAEEAMPKTIQITAK